MIITEQEFNFDKQIRKLTREEVEAALKRKPLARLWNRYVEKNTFDDLVNSTYKEMIFAYDSVKEFFSQMQIQKYCRMDYSVSDMRQYNLGLSHDLNITGSGNERFQINGPAKFFAINPDILTKKGYEITAIPVVKQSEHYEDKFHLILFNHPQLIIPQLGEIDVKYDFSTKLSLGSQGSSADYFTKDIIVNFISNSWFGKPGELVYRWYDGFAQELQKSIFGLMFNRLPNEYISEDRIANMTGHRDKFKLHGTVKLGKEFLYQGALESTGAWPFFI